MKNIEIYQKSIVFRAFRYDLELEYNLFNGHIRMSHIIHKNLFLPLYIVRIDQGNSELFMKQLCFDLVEKLQKKYSTVPVEIIFCEVMKSAGLLENNLESNYYPIGIINEMKNDIWKCEAFPNSIEMVYLKHVDTFFDYVGIK